MHRDMGILFWQVYIKQWIRAYLCDLLQSVRHYILEFLSPVSLHHGVNLLGAVAVVWNDRRQRGVPSNKRVSVLSYIFLLFL